MIIYGQAVAGNWKAKAGCSAETRFGAGPHFPEPLVAQEPKGKTSGLQRSLSLSNPVFFALEQHGGTVHRSISTSC
jgi:hypothetical protein